MSTLAYILGFQLTCKRAETCPEAAAAQTDTRPTPAQQETGNYAKGRLAWKGLEIAIENPKGSVRSGTSKSGKTWSIRMKAHYGYFARNGGQAARRDKDGDHVDVFVGPEIDSEIVFVINQLTEGGRFDEHKVMVGYVSEKAAKEAYLANYASGWTGLGSVRAMTLADFRQWLDSGDLKKPL